MSVRDRNWCFVSPLQRPVNFWFATGGAGFCISRGLALKMSPWARCKNLSTILMQHLRAYSMFYVDLLYSFYDSGGHFMNTAEKIRLPDDCTIGYIIESVLGVPLTRSSLFHSHLENLQQVSKSEVHKQVRKLIQALFSSVKCIIIVLTQCFIFNLDYIELWNVWKQEEYHQHERGFLCWGGLIQVRQVLNTLDHIWILLLFIFAYMYKSKLYFF